MLQVPKPQVQVRVQVPDPQVQVQVPSTTSLVSAFVFFFNLGTC